MGHVAAGSRPFAVVTRRRGPFPLAATEDDLVGANASSRSHRQRLRAGEGKPGATGLREQNTPASGGISMRSPVVSVPWCPVGRAATSATAGCQTLPFVRRVYALVGALALVTGFETAGIAQEPSASTAFQRIKPSLAIIASSVGLGTGFCIFSNDKVSYYLTNAHVVHGESTVTVFRQFPMRKTLTGTVLAKGSDEDPDLAVVRVPIGNTPFLRLRLFVPLAGDPVAIAGYPNAQYRLAAISGDLTPSVHVGTISAVVNHGGLLEYDAQTLPGNSGGPLFDPATGDVLGIVRAKDRESTDANLAIGVTPVVRRFLTEHSLAFTAAIPGAPSEHTSKSSANLNDSGSPRVLPGAGTVALIYDPKPTGANQSAVEAIAAAAQDFADKFASRFIVRAVLAPTHATSVDDITQAAKAHDALIAVGFWPRIQTTNLSAAGYRVTCGVKVRLTDPYGITQFSASKETEIESRTLSTAITECSLSELQIKSLRQSMSRLRVGMAATRPLLIFSGMHSRCQTEHGGPSSP